MTRTATEIVRNTAPGARVELDLSAADLRDLAQAYLDRKAALDVREIGVEIESPAVIIRGVTSLLGRDMTIEVRGTPGVKEGRIAIALGAIEVNGAPAPRFAASEIGGFLQRKFASPKLLLRIESVAVTEQTIRVVGYRTDGSE